MERGHRQTWTKWKKIANFANKYNGTDNGALSDSAVEFGGRLQKNSSTQGWSTTIYHVGVDHVEN